MMGLGLLIPVLLIGAVAYAAGWRPQFPSSGQGQAPGGPAKDDAMRRYGFVNLNGKGAGEVGKFPHHRCTRFDPAFRAASGEISR